MEKYYFGIGRRKTAVAQARIKKGSGLIEVKGGKIDEKHFDEIKKPFDLLDQSKNFDVTLVLKGGGKISQKEAAILGIARALSKINQDFEKNLKKQGLMTRDARKKERKKPGLKRARRAPQWQKR
ncbi:MAG: 30S ribosomal protein S9 [Candidatus Berkelbacteria bacterium]|nr:30S ribosomal protein S9 [Candidatus Berkelbacteria bacterium]